LPVDRKCGSVERCFIRSEEEVLEMNQCAAGN